MIYLISDTHFFHKKIISLTSRPEDFEKRIWNSWTKRVKPEDTIYHLGDVALERVRVLREWYERKFRLLPGRKCLIRGNHDKWIKPKELLKWWDEVYSEKVLEYKHLRILLTHVPRYDRLDKDGVVADINIHGHQHNGVPPDAGPKRNFLLALENDGYRVWRLGDFLLKKARDKGIHLEDLITH